MGVNKRVVLDMDNLFSDYQFDPNHCYGLAEEIINDVNKRAIREQPRLSAISAIYALAACLSSHLLTPEGIKTNLYCVGVAPSGGGKDNGRSYVAELLRKMEIRAAGSIASTKSIGEEILNNGGHANFIVDEAHKLFNTMKDGAKQGAAYKDEIGETLMSVYTQKIFLFDTVTLRSERASKEDKIKRLNRDSKDEGFDQGGSEYTKRLNEIEARLKLVELGLENPVVCLYGVSTPDKMRGFFTPDAFASGLVGRLIVVMGSEERATCEWTETGSNKIPISDRVVAQLTRLRERAKGTITYAAPSDAEVARQIHERFELGINDPEAGDLMVRAYETVIRIATLIAAGDGMHIKANHLKWAYKFYCSSMTDAYLQLMDNLYQTDNGIEARWNELADRIISLTRATTDKNPIYRSELNRNAYKRQGSKLIDLVKRCFPSDLDYGKSELVSMYLGQALLAGFMDCRGQKWWISDKSKAADVPVDPKFVKLCMAARL